MQFTSKLNPSHPVTLEATKVAVCNWYDNNDAALDAPALDPKKLIVVREGERWAVSYPFIGIRPGDMGWCNEEPV